MEIHNEKSQPMKVWLEPIPELYLLKPNTEATVVSLFTTQADRDRTGFAVGLTDEGTLIVYTNGFSDDTYIEVDGQKLSPVG